MATLARGRWRGYQQGRQAARKELRTAMKSADTKAGRKTAKADYLQTIGANRGVYFGTGDRVAQRYLKRAEKLRPKPGISAVQGRNAGSGLPGEERYFRGWPQG